MKSPARLRKHSGPASSPLVQACVLGMLAVAVGLAVRPRLTGSFGGFGNDAATIQWIMSSPFNASDLGFGSYAVIAGFYSSIGMVDAPFAASILGAVIGAAVLAVVLIRVGGVHAHRLTLALAALTAVAIGIYEAAYAKEVLISLGMLVIVLMPVNWIGEFVVVAALIVLGAEFRSYWLIVAALYVALRLMFARRPAGENQLLTRSPWRICGLLLALAVATGLAVWILAGVPSDSFRIDANDTAARQANTGSLITRFVDAPEPLGGMINSTLTSLFFVIPLPMVLKFSPYYLVIGLIFALIWISAIRAATKAGRGAPLLSRLVAVPLAFLIVQGLFEPDWGSALRHATPLIPLVVGAVALSAHQGRSSQNTAQPPPGVHTTSTEPSVTTGKTPPQRQRTNMTSQNLTSANGSSGHTARNVLSDYLSYVRRWWWLSVIGLVIGGLVGWGASALMTQQYTATSQVYVGTGSAGGSGDAYQGVLMSQKQVGSYAEMADSRALGQRIVDDLHLDKTAGEVSSMITAGAHKDTVILDLKATSSDADLARDVANSAATQLQAMVHELNAQTAPDGASGAPQLALLNEAESPSAPSSPNTMMNIVLGAVLGLVLGAIAAVVKGLTDRRITDASTIIEIVDSPLIGTVSTTTALANSHTLDFGAAPSPSTEQFRGMRTNLRFLDVDNAPTVLAVTSGMPGEGKSTIAVNLALALADDGESVVLVDADLRSPSVATYVGGNLQSAVGLSTALAGAAVIEDVIQPTAIEGLSVVTAGPTPPNPAELLGSRRFGEVLAQLAAQFDHVILDASPVLPVTDGALVAASADGVLLAVRHADTTTDQLSEATASLSAVNSRVLGTIFTRTPGKNDGRYGYGYGTYGTTRPTAPAAAGAAAARDESTTAVPAPTEDDHDSVTVPYAPGAHRADSDPS